MKNFLRGMGILAVLAAVVFGAASCGSDPDVQPTAGVTGQQWKEVEQVSGGATSKSFAFKALGAWTARSISSWVTIETLSGAAGDAVLRLAVAENTTGAERSATITVAVDGYSAVSFTLTQSAETSASAENETLDRWMFDYMKSHYLWNEAVANVTPDYTMEYKAFLQKVLVDIAAQGDVNHDDGHWEIGKSGQPERQSFYSNIQRYPITKSTRGTRETIDGFGIDYLAGGAFVDGQGNRTGEYFFIVLAVVPGSPADKAGVQRGDYIIQVAGRAITDATFTSDANLLMSYTSAASVTFTPGVLKDGGLAKGDPKTLAWTTYDDNPVWLAKTFDTDKGKVGYLWYNSFNLNYDDELIAAVGKLKAEGAKELILDLRYNGGGHVVSSVVLGTLVSGSAKKGQVYASTTYNASRTAAGEKGAVYYLGNDIIKYGATNGGDARYEPIGEALPSALGLQTVYVLGTANTASASELVINGLRGVDIDVRLIGGQTNGKNVGMEPITKELGDWEYDFSPITFYSANAKGFKEYSDGFKPDVEANGDRGTIYPMGDERDAMIAAALSWIATGQKPAVSVVAHTRADGAELFSLPRPPRRLDGMIAVPLE